MSYNDLVDWLGECGCIVSGTCVGRDGQIVGWLSSYGYPGTWTFWHSARSR